MCAETYGPLVARGLEEMNRYSLTELEVILDFLERCHALAVDHADACARRRSAGYDAPSSDVAGNQATREHEREVEVRADPRWGVADGGDRVDTVHRRPDPSVETRVVRIRGTCGLESRRGSTGHLR